MDALTLIKSKIDDYNVIRVCISPAKGVLTENDIDIIKDAIFYANMNLFYKHKSYVSVADVNLDYNGLLIDLFRPKTVNFNVGSSLSGIAAHIRKTNNDFNTRHSNSNRMFNYAVKEEKHEQTWL